MLVEVAGEYYYDPLKLSREQDHNELGATIARIAEMMI